MVTYFICTKNTTICHFYVFLFFYDSSERTARGCGDKKNRLCNDTWEARHKYFNTFVGGSKLQCVLMLHGSRCLIMYKLMWDYDYDYAD